MAPQSRTEDPGVIARDNSFVEVEAAMKEHPGRFEFFQLVRILLRVLRDRQPPGLFTSVTREAVRFRSNNSLAFPPSQIDTINWDGPMPVVSVNFMGLTGPMGVLPRP